MVASQYVDKTSGDVDRLMTHFSKELVFYADATVGGLSVGWAAAKKAYESFLPPAGSGAVSYPTRIIGDERSAMVLFTDSPQYLGGELIVIAPVDFRDGKIIREVDYWDGRHFGSAQIGNFRTPISQWPANYGEDAVPDQSSPVLRQVVAALSSAISGNDPVAATALFSSDAIFEDLTLHLRLAGPLAIGGFLARALPILPYGPGAAVRHTVGSAQGGGYEWLNKAAQGAHPTPVWQGCIALELDEHAKISRFTAVWDGALMDDPTLTTLLATTIEH
jgi:hypothetical protein